MTHASHRVTRSCNRRHSAHAVIIRKIRSRLCRKVLPWLDRQWSSLQTKNQQSSRFSNPRKLPRVKKSRLFNKLVARRSLSKQRKSSRKHWSLGLTKIQTLSSTLGRTHSWSGLHYVLKLWSRKVWILTLQRATKRIYHLKCLARIRVRPPLRRQQLLWRLVRRSHSQGSLNYSRLLVIHSLSWRSSKMHQVGT